MKIPFYHQETCWTCGAATMRMALEYFGIKRSEKQVVKLLKTNKAHGSPHKNFSLVAEHFRINHTTMRNAKIRDIKDLISNNWVVIIGQFDTINNFGHYVVVNKVYGKFLYLNDPSLYKEDKRNKITCKKFNSIWYDTEKEKGWLFALKK
ncbi:MAG: cysteine peptidase family C39 domain-containing protein [Nanoarchaeota archaeon]